MELRVQVDDAFMEELRKKLGYSKSTDIARDALTILNWAAHEKSQGREILSMGKDGSDMARLAMPALEKIIG